MTPLARLLLALALAALTPVVALLLWVSWSTGKAGDGQHVAWFVTVALGTLAAGWTMPRRVLAGAVVSLVAAVVTMTVLYRWWASQDTEGLFLVGVLLAAPVVTAAAPALVAVGSDLRVRLAGRAGRDGRVSRVSRGPRRPAGAARGR